MIGGMDEEGRIRALAAEGFSGRRIARELGIDRGKVQRLLAGSRTPAPLDRSDDPIMSLLTPDDLKWLGLTPPDLAGGLSVLERFRFLGLPAGSVAGDAARGLFDHGRGEEAFTEWVYAGTGGTPEDVLAWLAEE